MVSIGLPQKLSKMKFWQKRKKLEISDTDHVYKVVYLGNVATNWAKGESTLEKPLTTLWKNYCNNYANFYAKNSSQAAIDGKKAAAAKFQSKQILMKLTICNQGLKALTREFGLTEYWANRITFCGTSSHFPRVFAWIYRHEGKKFKQELRVHACLVNKQVSVSKMITALQTRLTCALDEFKREQKLKENVRRISLMRNQLPLLDDDLNPSLSDEFDELDYTPLRKHADNQLDNLSQLSISSDSKGSSFQQMYRHLSQASLTSLRSKSSTSSSRKSVPMYEPNHAMPLRKQLLLKGSKNFKEPLERTKSAPKLGSILEELSSDDEDNFFGESFSFTEEQFATQDLQSQESHDSETIDLMSPQNDIVRAVSYKNNPDTCSNNENFERLFQQSSNLLAQLTRSQSTCRSAEHNERALCDQFQHILLDQRPHLNQCDT